MADNGNCVEHSEKIAVMSAIVRKVNGEVEAAFTRIDELKAEVVTLRIEQAKVEGDVKRSKEDIIKQIDSHKELKKLTEANKGGLTKIFAAIAALVYAVGLGITVWKVFH